MKKVKQDKLPASIHWWSKNRKYVVISGPFPDGFIRSETRKSVASAIQSVDWNWLDDHIYARPAAQKGYAVVLAASVQDKCNEWGEISL